MKTFRTLIMIVAGIFAAGSVQAQVLKPVITFTEDPLTHNVHIVSDGSFYYTVNGGRADKGQINKFSFQGKLVDSYDIKLDMRSIMYNGKDKLFYVCTYERDIYKITDLSKGIYEKVLSGIYEDPQANLAMSPDGKYIYCMSGGTLTIYKFPSGKVSKTISNLNCGKEFSTGSSSVATDGQRIYTWNSDYKMIFVYDLKGKKIKTFDISKGDYGFSLSWANGLLFVSTDGNYETGTWYGYDLWAK